MTLFEAYILTSFSFIIIVILCLYRAIVLEDKDSVDKLRKIIFFIFLPVFMLSSLFLILMPSSKEMAFIYIAPAIVNNKDFQKTIQKIPELSGLGLEYLTETLKGKNKKND